MTCLSIAHSSFYSSLPRGKNNPSDCSNIDLCDASLRKQIKSNQWLVDPLKGTQLKWIDPYFVGSALCRWSSLIFHQFNNGRCPGLLGQGAQLVSGSWDSCVLLILHPSLFLELQKIIQVCKLIDFASGFRLMFICFIEYRGVSLGPMPCNWASHPFKVKQHPVSGREHGTWLSVTDGFLFDFSDSYRRDIHSFSQAIIAVISRISLSIINTMIPFPLALNATSCYGSDFPAALKMVVLVFPVIT